MSESSANRKLTTILSADAAGYSRLTGDDEEATHATLNAYRELVQELIGAYGGRVFGGAGDSVMAEFPSPVEAVRSAIAIQEALAERNAELPPKRRMQFRIGINLGDVIIESHGLYGDSVNIAARLQALAAPGDICISEIVQQQVANKLDRPSQRRHAAGRVGAGQGQLRGHGAGRRGHRTVIDHGKDGAGLQCR